MLPLTVFSLTLTARFPMKRPNKELIPAAALPLAPLPWPFAEKPGGSFLLAFGPGLTFPPLPGTLSSILSSTEFLVKSSFASVLHRARIGPPPSCHQGKQGQLVWLFGDSKPLSGNRTYRSHSLPGEAELSAWGDLGRLTASVLDTLGHVGELDLAAASGPAQALGSDLSLTKNGRVDLGQLVGTRVGHRAFGQKAQRSGGAASVSSLKRLC